MTLDSYEHVLKPSERLCKPLRQLIAKAVRNYVKHPNNPIHMTQIIRLVYTEIKEQRRQGLWNGNAWTPGTLTIRRRVEECADKAFWTGETPLIRPRKDGWYELNPECSSEATK